MQNRGITREPRSDMSCHYRYMNMSQNINFQCYFYETIFNMNARVASSIIAAATTKYMSEKLLSSAHMQSVKNLKFLTNFHVAKHQFYAYKKSY